MRKSNIKCTIYTHNDCKNTRIAIIETPTTYESYLQIGIYGVADYMFGVMKKDCTLYKFKQMINNQIDQYIEFYFKKRQEKE